jgi:hypothetical protein
MVEGRHATVTGIVRAAYPTAADQRATLLPRSVADVRVSGAATGGAGGSGGTPGAGASTEPGGSRAEPGTIATSAPSGVLDADLADLADVIGQTVRVGGLVVDPTDDGFTLDDGTAVGAVVLVGEALVARDLVEPGDAINVVGRVTASPAQDGSFVVSVDDPDTIVLGSMDRAGVMPMSPSATVASARASDDTLGTSRAAGLAGGFDPLAGGAGILSVLGIGLASIVATALRRRHARRLLESRVAVRLAAFAGPALGTAPGPDRDPDDRP